MKIWSSVVGIFAALAAIGTGAAQEPVAIDTMPEGTLLFAGGTAISYPDGWQIYTDDRTTVSNNAMLMYGDNLLTAQANVLITINDAEEIPVALGRNIVFSLGMIYTGNENFSLETDLLIETLPDGRTIESVDVSKAEQFLGNSYMVILNDDTWVWLSFTMMGVGDAAARQAEVLEMARTLTITEPIMPKEQPGIRYEGFILSPDAASCTAVVDAMLVSEDAPYALAECPANCVATGDMNSIWGTDIYTSDSGLCTAAVHSGAISDADGGLVLTTWLPGQDVYLASEQNGVSSSDYGAWNDSFRVEAFDLEAYLAANPDAMVEPASDDALLPCDITPQNGTWSYAALAAEVNTCPSAIMGFFDTFNAPLTSQVDFGDPFDPETLILTSSTEPFPGEVTFATLDACTYTATYAGTEGTFIYTWQVESETEISGSFDFNFAEGLDCQLLIPFTTERTGE